MISGAAQADVCLLMVPADGNFTTAIQKGDHKVRRGGLVLAFVILAQRPATRKPSSHALQRMEVGYHSSYHGMHTLR